MPRGRMSSNLDRYKKDLEALSTKGAKLLFALLAATTDKERLKKVLKIEDEESFKKFIKELPSLESEYQVWYSEAKDLIKQILPDRLNDFVSHYEKPKSRKRITYESYRIEDCLQNLRITNGLGETIADKSSALPHLEQQLAIVSAAKARFESSLYDIRKLVQADLFDSELDAAKELIKNGFIRASGAIAGVVLEKHLAEICDQHSIKITRSSHGISSLNDSLKKGSVIDVAQWRFIQHLADIRNLCDHDKDKEPSAEQVTGLIEGVEKVIKTVY